MKPLDSESSAKLTRAEAISRGLKLNNGWTLWLSGMYMTQPFPWYLSIGAFYVLNISVHMYPLLTTVYVLRDELAPCFEAVHFVIFLTMTLSIVLNSLLQRTSLDTLLEGLGREVFQFTTLDEYCQTAYEKDLAVTRTRKQTYSKVFSSAVFGAGFGIALRPIIQPFFSTNQRDPRDGITTGMIIEGKYPFDLTSNTVFYLVALFQYIIDFTSIPVVLGCDVFFLCAAEEILVQLRLARLSFNRLFQRTEFMMKVRGERGPEAFNRCLREAMTESVKHHQAIIQLFQTMRSFLYSLLLVLLGGMAVMMCSAGLFFISKNSSVLSKLVFFMFLVTECIHAFIFCYYGDQISEESSNLTWGLYESDWLKSSGVIRQDILILNLRCRRPLELSARGFMSINLKLYKDVIQNAYSYFNILNAAN